MPCKHAMFSLVALPHSTLNCNRSSSWPRQPLFLLGCLRMEMPTAWATAFKMKMQRPTEDCALVAFPEQAASTQQCGLHNSCCSRWAPDFIDAFQYIAPLTQYAQPTQMM